LTKKFGDRLAVDDLSIHVQKGEVYGFLGQNGAGKSTTLRMLLTLIEPTSGEINIFSKSIKQHRTEILKNIGSIVEKPDFYKYLSAQKNLELFARISGITVDKSKVHELIEFVGLKGRENDKISGFSHGMKQRLGIAQTLIHNPDLIILDEPTTGLDPQGIIDIRNLILQLKNEQGKTVILSSHILSEIELIANRMIIINKGQTIVQGSVSELLNSAELIVSFTVNDVDAAKQILLNSAFSSCLESSTHSNLLLHTSQENISIVNKLFCENGINVSAIETKRKLEDYFLKLITS
jgi:ABC-type multidrug transport system ATPase subunit